MFEYRLSMAFDPGVEPAKYEERQAAYEAVGKAVGPLLEGVPGKEQETPLALKVDLTPAACGALAAALGEIAQRGLATFDMVRIDERMAKAQADAAEWFVLRPKKWMEMDLVTLEGLHRIKAERVKGKELVGHYCGEYFVREEVRAFMEAQGYRGVQTVWVQDVGKYRAAQWYLVQGTVMLGRGVDHPWFDAGTLGSFKTEVQDVQPTTPAWRFGARQFGLDQLRADAEGGSAEMTGLLKFLRSCGVYKTRYAGQHFVKGPFRMLRRFLPDSEVAYLWEYPPVMCESHYRSGHVVCVRQEVRQALLARKFATGEDFEAVAVLDEPPAGCAVLDKAGDAGPGPLFDERWMKRLRPREEKALAKFMATPRPEKAADFKPVFTALKKRAKKEKDAFKPGATEEALQEAAAKLPMAVPGRWKEVLAVADGFEADASEAVDGDTVRVASCEGLPDEHKRALAMVAISSPNLPATLLGVADTFFGDAILLDVSKVTMEGDCPVLHVDHETGEVVNTWPSIAVFIQDVLTREKE